MVVMPFRLSVCGLSDIGCVRSKNEDSWGQLPEDNFFALADGMGGHRAGGVASKEAIRALLKIIQQKLADFPSHNYSCQEVARVIRLGMEEVNRLVYELSKTEEDWRGMGTTLCCLHVQAEGMVYAHVGDSRIYRYRQGKLEQLTDDHSLLRELIRLGQIKEQSRADFQYKNIITRAIGTEPIVEPSVNITDLTTHDVILMCSDGLSDLLTFQEMEQVLSSPKELRLIAESLISEAKLKGGLDNITVILIKIQEVDGTADLPG